MAKIKKRAFVSKKVRKKSEGKCRICGEADYVLLDVHRIKHGSSYTFDGTLVLCSKCHRLVHADKIKIIGWFKSTAGRLLHIIDAKGNENFV